MLISCKTEMSGLAFMHATSNLKQTHFCTKFGTVLLDEKIRNSAVFNEYSMTVQPIITFNPSAEIIDIFNEWLMLARS